jgi:hypothetical protein
MAMLRHKPTGDLYVATSALIARGDMEVVEDAAPADAGAKPKPKTKAKAAIAGTDDLLADDLLVDD